MNLYLGVLLLTISDIVIWFYLNAGEIFNFHRSLLWWFCVTGWVAFFVGTQGWWLVLETVGIWKTVVIYSILTLCVDIILNCMFCGFEGKYIISLLLCLIAGLVSH